MFRNIIKGKSFIKNKKYILYFKIDAFPKQTIIWIDSIANMFALNFCILKSFLNNWKGWEYWHKSWHMGSSCHFSWKYDFSLAKVNK